MDERGQDDVRLPRRISRLARVGRRALAALGRVLVRALAGESEEDLAYTPRVIPTYAPVDDQVEDGVLIASSGVRLAVKNILIIRALRDSKDFDLDWYLEATRHEFELMADEKLRDADRIADSSISAAQRRGRPTRFDDFRAHDVQHLDVREQIARSLGERLRAASADDDFIRGQVALAQEAAADELSRAITVRIISQNVGDADYAEQREARLQLLESDLALLSLQQRGL